MEKVKIKNKMNNPYVHIKNTTSGITLIALIITIIVLLILAGITITSITGENGILQKAAYAKEQQIIGEDKERIDLTLSEYKILKYESNAPTIEEFFKSKNWCKNATLNDTTLTVEMTNGNKYDIEINAEYLSQTIKFYQPYQAKINGITGEYVFHEDGSLDLYVIDLKEGSSSPAGTAIYEEGLLTLDGKQSIIHNGGKSFTIENNSESFTFNLISKKVHYIYYGSKYTFTDEENNYTLSAIFYEDGSIEIAENEETEFYDSGTVMFYEKSYEFDGEKHAVYPDGTKIIFFGMIMEIDCSHANTEIKNQTDNYTGDICCKDCGVLIERGMYLSGEPYALYFNSNKTLVFTRSEDTLSIGDTYHGNEISAVYTGFENDRYTIGGGRSRAAMSKEATTPWFEHAYDIIKVEFDCIIKPVSTMAWFYCFENCTSIDLTNLDMSNVDDTSYMFASSGITNIPQMNITEKTTNLSYMFKECYSLANLNGFNIQNGAVIIDDIFSNCSSISDFSKITIPNTVESMNNAFYNCTSMTVPPNLSNATNVIYMSYAFCNCENLEIAPIIPSAENMSGIFANCYKLTTAPTLPNNLLYGSNMFDKCYELITYHNSTEENGYFTNYSIPSSVQYLDSAFYYCESLISVPDLDHCTNLKSISTIFRDCKSLIYAPKLPANIEDMSFAFAYDENLETTPVLNHCTKLLDMSYAFLFCRKITVAPIIPSTVTNIKETFANTKINTYHDSTDSTGDFSNYVIPTGVTSIYGTFQGCLGIVNAPIISENIKDMTVAFDECRNLTSITINANPTSYGSCFRIMTTNVNNPPKDLTISGSSTMLQELANTSSKRVVYDIYGNVLKQ